MRPLNESNVNARAAPRPVDTSKEPIIVARDISSAMSTLSLKTRASVADFRTSPSKLPRPSTPIHLPSVMAMPISRQKSPPKSARFLTKDSLTETSWDIDEQNEDAERMHNTLRKSVVESQNAAEKWKQSAKESRKTIEEYARTRKYSTIDHSGARPNLKITVSILKQKLSERDIELQQLRDSHIADIRQLTEQYTTRRDTHVANSGAQIKQLQDSHSVELRQLKDDLNTRHNTEIS